jgi:ankyrin repeat protein
METKPNPLQREPLPGTLPETTTDDLPPVRPEWDVMPPEMRIKILEDGIELGIFDVDELLTTAREMPFKGIYPLVRGTVDPGGQYDISDYKDDDKTRARIAGMVSRFPKIKLVRLGTPVSLGEKLRALAYYDLDVTAKRLLTPIDGVRPVGIDGANKRGETALMVAAMRDKVDVATVLLDNGARVNAINPKSGSTCLMVAAEHNSPGVARLLLDRVASASPEGRADELVRLYVNEGDHNRVTALMLAAKGGYPEIVEMLLDSGADIDSGDIESYTALSYACKYNQANVVNLLLERNADISKRDISGHTPLHTACGGKSVEIVKLLLDRVASASPEGRADELVRRYVNEGDHSGITALMLAANGGYPEIVEMLLDSGADIDSGDTRSYTALYYACMYNQANVVNLLLERNADISKRNSSGRTPLHAACEEQSLEIVKLLLGRNADANDHAVITGNHTLTPLYSIYNAGIGETGEYNTLAIMEELIKYGADVDYPCYSNGGTVLYAACANGDYEIADFLINKGADIKKKLHQVIMDPAVVAYQNGHIKIVERLAQRSQDLGISKQYLSPLLLQAARRHDGESCSTAKMLVRYGADVNQQREYDGQTALHIACHKENGIAEIILFGKIVCLVHLKANLEVKDESGNTPLHIAYSSGNLLAAVFLIIMGAPRDATNDAGHTPSQLAKGEFNKKVDKEVQEYRASHPHAPTQPRPE